MAEQLEGRILITGGAGFLGRAIMRRAAQDEWPAEFIVYSRDEYKQALCRRKFPQAKYVLGDIRDTDRLQLSMLGVDSVIHAAALKYVPQGETNVSECISINVGGTQAVLDAARRAEVRRIVCISTDKAVAPVNVYGMTKALVERLVDERSDQMRCVAVRYGNVIGSTGSVIPEFMRLAAEGQPLPVTDPAMTRFWMPADDAVDLILYAHHAARPGSTVVRAAEAMTLRDLATAIADERVPLNVLGARPGERLHETLLTEAESLYTWPHPDGYFEIPCTDLRRPLGREFPYAITSDKVDHITYGEMLVLIEDAETI